MKRIEVAQRIGYVPQRYTDTDMSAFDVVLLGRKPHIGWAIAEKDLQITEDILAMLNGVDGFTPHIFSQRRRDTESNDWKVACTVTGTFAA